MTASKTARARLILERLEERANPSSYINKDGSLVIVGTNAPDHVTVTRTSDSWYYGGEVYQVTEGMTVTEYPVSKVRSGRVYFSGHGGNDWFDGRESGLRVIADGGAGNDILLGGARNDVLRGGAGDDFLQGNGGSDRLFGEAGRDWLDGGSDGVRDWLDGGTQRDFFFADAYLTDRGRRNRDAILDRTAQDIIVWRFGDGGFGGGFGHDFVTY